MRNVQRSSETTHLLGPHSMRQEPHAPSFKIENGARAMKLGDRASALARGAERKLNVPFYLNFHLRPLRVLVGSRIKELHLTIQE